jgi:hypothetical protein
VSVLNLVLILGVIRRLRGPAPGPAPKVTLASGESPAEFTATTLDGETITREGLAGSLVGFFSPDCPACAERLPEFVKYAEALGGRDRAFAILIGEPEELTGLAERLDGVARLLTEPDFGPVAEAFAVKGYPAICLLDSHGVVAHSGTDLVRFPPAKMLRLVSSGA